MRMIVGADALTSTSSLPNKARKLRNQTTLQTS